jgi:DnaJ-class molecular chaperone
MDQAYAVLSDPTRRRMLDQRIRAPSFKQREPFSLFSRPEYTHPSFAEFYERYLRNFTGSHIPKAEQAQGLTVDTLLSREEMATGCSVLIAAPVYRACRECLGTGHISLYPCNACRASGMIESERTLEVSCSPFTPPGAVVETSLGDLGITNLFLRTRVVMDA